MPDPQSLNRYSYVTNRPMAHSDELGLDDHDDDDDDGGGWDISFSFDVRQSRA